MDLLIISYYLYVLNLQQPCAPIFSNPLGCSLVMPHYS